MCCPALKRLHHQLSILLASEANNGKNQEDYDEKNGAQSLGHFPRIVQATCK
jgi:hypothetical protein